MKLKRRDIFKDLRMPVSQKEKMLLNMWNSSSERAALTIEWHNILLTKIDAKDKRRLGDHKYVKEYINKYYDEFERFKENWWHFIEKKVLNESKKGA